MQELTNEIVRALAAANGLAIPDERLDLVRRQHDQYLRTLGEIATLPLPREAEPRPLVPVSPAPAPTPLRRA